jgi:pantothenate kinase-related protein Tda10
MSPNEIQFERYWRQQISQEIAMYALVNKSINSEEMSEMLDHLREHVGSPIS